MPCLFLLQRQFFQKDVDKHKGIATMFSEFGIVTQETVFRGSFCSIMQLQLSGLLVFF